MLPHFLCYNVRHFGTQKHGRKKDISNLTLAARTILVLLFGQSPDTNIKKNLNSLLWYKTKMNVLYLQW
jgi:hypothetical protein